MDSPLVILNAFDQEFHIPRELLTKSPLLRTMLTGCWKVNHALAYLILKESRSGRITLHPEKTDPQIDDYNFLLALNTLAPSGKSFLKQFNDAYDFVDESESNPSRNLSNSSPNPFSLFAAANFLQLEPLMTRCITRVGKFQK